MLKLSKIKIGHIQYDITHEESLIGEDGEQLYGLILYQEQKIKLRKGLKPDREIEVLLHEIIHGISSENLLDLDEKTVNTLGNGLAQVLIDSPTLLDYIRQKKRRIDNG